MNLPLTGADYFLKSVFRIGYFFGGLNLKPDPGKFRQISKIIADFGQSSVGQNAIIVTTEMDSLESFTDSYTVDRHALNS